MKENVDELVLKEKNSSFFHTRKWNIQENVPYHVCIREYRILCLVTHDMNVNAS